MASSKGEGFIFILLISRLGLEGFKPFGQRYGNMHLEIEHAHHIELQMLTATNVYYHITTVNLPYLLSLTQVSVFIRN